MISFKRADHINITVPAGRLEEARDFYRDVIGLSPIARPDEVFSLPGYWFTMADIELHIGVEASAPRSTRHTGFEVNNLSDAEKYLKDSGVEIVEEPVIPGRNRFAFIDPFGNRIELLQFD